MSTPTNELQHVGALRKEREGRRTYYRAIESAPLWTAMRVLEGASRDPGPLLEAGLVDVPGLQAALIFGSAATGEQREAIDLDVLIVEEPTADHRKLLRHLAEAALLLSREVDAVRYTP